MMMLCDIAVLSDSFDSLDCIGRIGGKQRELKTTELIEGKDPAVATADEFYTAECNNNNNNNNNNMNNRK
jgi:hypothetical protein